MKLDCVTQSILVYMLVFLVSQSKLKLLNLLYTRLSKFFLFLASLQNSTLFVIAVHWYLNIDTFSSIY
jgi:hypothetical protein